MVFSHYNHRLHAFLLQGSGCKICFGTILESVSEASRISIRVLKVDTSKFM